MLFVCLLLFKELSLLCFDEAYAAALGQPTRRLDLLLTSLVVAVTVIGMPSVGLLLVVAQLVIPPTAARFWTDRHGPLAVVSGVLGGLSCAVGILISAVVPRMAAGAVIVLAGTMSFAISLLFGTRRGIVWNWQQQRESSRRIGQMDLLRACFEIVEGSSPNRRSVSPKPTVFRDSTTGSIEADPNPSVQRDLTAVPITRDQLLVARTWSTTRLWSVLSAAQHDGVIRHDADGHYRLTAEGARRARRAARNHRLWELYLIHFAHIASSRVDREADQIEHVLEPEIIEQLEQLLEQDAAPVRVPVNPHT